MDKIKWDILLSNPNDINLLKNMNKIYYDNYKIQVYLKLTKQLKIYIDEQVKIINRINY